MNWQLRFFAFWVAQAFSLFGSSLTQFALVWYLTQATGSATVLATATLVATLPGVLLGPFAGVLVDRWNRRLLIVAADAASALAAATLAVLFWADAIQVWHIYTAMAVRALAQAFQNPAVLTSTPQMVPEAQLARVAGFTQMLQGLMTIVAPPLGALLLGVLSFQGMMAVDVVTAVIAITLVLLIHIPQPSRSEKAASFVQEFRAGLQYIQAWPALLSLVGVSALLNLLLSPAFALIPILITKHFNAGATQLAWMEAAGGVGLVLGGLLLGVWGGFRRRIFTIMFGLAGIGVGTLFVGLAPANALLLAIAGNFLAALMSQLANGPTLAIYQSIVAPEMQGRVFTVLISVATGSAPLGLAIAGPVADAFGVRAWYIAGAVLCIAVSGVIALTPTLMRLEDGRAESETAS